MNAKRVLMLCLMPVLAMACVTTTETSNTGHYGNRPDDGAVTAESYNRSVDRTFESLSKYGHSAKAKHAALDNAKFNALQDLARQVEAYFSGPLPEFKSLLVSGARFVRADPVGTDAINVTAEVVMQDVLVRYQNSDFYHKVNDVLKKRVVEVRETYGDKTLRAVGTGICEEEPAGTTSVPNDGFPTGVVR